MDRITERIDAVIGEERRKILFEACKDEADLKHCSKLVLDNTEVSLNENLLIVMVKVCIQSRMLHTSKRHDQAIALISQLGLDEDTRRFMYECLFDKKGLEGPGIKIYTRPE